MKIRIKKTSKINLATKVTLVFSSILIAVAVPMQIMSNIAHAGCSTISECDAKINATNQDISNYNIEIARLSSEAQTLESTVARLSAEKSVIQAQIDVSQASYDKLVTQIADTEKSIKDNKDALGVTIASLYVDDNITPIEMLASSQSISDYLDKQEYRSSVRNELSTTISKIKSLKEELEKQKTDIERVLSDQTSQKNALASKEAEQQQLLENTKSNANAYQAITNELATQIAQLSADRITISTPPHSSETIYIGPFAVYFRNWSGNVNCGGGYAYCGYSLDAYVSDSWGLHLAGECVHYAAWALANRGYYIPYDAFSVNNGYGGGNANKWVDVATDKYNQLNSNINNGEPFANLVNVPQKDDLAFMPTSGVGHVGIVEENYGNGWVRISQYNFNLERYSTTPMYSTVDLQITGDTQFLRFSR